MHMEDVRNQVMAALQGQLPSRLAELDQARGGDPTPAPVSYFDHPILQESMVSWPVCIVMSRRASRAAEADATVTRRYHLTVEIWHNEAEPEPLQRYVERSAEAAAAVLEDPATWAGSGLFAPRVSDAYFSDVLPDEGGFVRACRLEFEISEVGGG